jgi:parvulin-like peptidyl-prolyl isomerase
VKSPQPVFSLATLCLLLFGCGGRPAEDSVAARVGSASITREQLMEEYGLKEWSQNADSSFQTAFQDAARNWALHEILFQEATKRRLESDSIFQRRMEDLRREMLINRLYETAASAIEAESLEVEQEYLNSREEFVCPADQIDLIYIIAPTRETAAAVRRLLQEGRELTSILSEVPDVYGDAPGWVAETELNPKIARTAFSLPPGAVSYPLKRDEGGYIVLQCRQRRFQGTVLPLDKVFDDVKERVVLKKRDEREQALRDSLWNAYQSQLWIAER